MTHLALALLSARQLATLSWPDILILLMYFVLVIFIAIGAIAVKRFRP